MMFDLDLDSVYKKVSLVKSSGETLEILADIQNKIYLKDVNTPIEIGDRIICMRGTITDTYEVTNFIIYSDGDDELDHIEVSYRNVASPVSQDIQIHGNISADRVYFNSIDQSMNIGNQGIDDSRFGELKEVLSNIQELKPEILDLVDELKNSVGKPTYKDKYVQFMSNVSSHITVLSPFIGWLSELL